MLGGDLTVHPGGQGANRADDVVGTTGAGDAFTGAIAHRPARSDDLVTAVRYAVKVGTAAVRGAGAQSAYATEGAWRDCGHDGARGGKRFTSGALVVSARRAGTVQP